MISPDQSASIRAAIACHLNSIARYAAMLREPRTATERKWMRQNQRVHQAQIVKCQEELRDGE